MVNLGQVCKVLSWPLALSVTDRTLLMHSERLLIIRYMLQAQFRQVPIWCLTLIVEILRTMRMVSSWVSTIWVWERTKLVLPQEILVDRPLLTERLQE